jgi:DNA-binding CsgD family transcriptional regulator
MMPHVQNGVIGRERELAAFDSFLTGLAKGRGQCVLVEGEPGIGKSALLEAGLAAARYAEIAVSHGVCDELGQRFPLSVLLDALGVKEAGPGDGAAPATPSAARGWSVSLVAGDPVMAAVERLLVLVDRRCGAGPLVLAVDDLQWADDASLLVWQQLCRATTQLPLLLVGTYRPVPRRPELVRLRRDVQARHGMLLSLGRLSPDGVAELVLRLTGGAPGPGLSLQLELASGNPFYAREILDTLTRTKALAVVGGAAELVADSGRSTRSGGLVSLGAAIADRLDFLSDGTLEVLRSAALLGPEFSVTDLAQVVGRPAGSLAGAVQEGIDAGVLEPSGLRLKFRHGLLKQALYQAIPGPLRIALHRDAALALMTNGAPVERVAELILASMDSADGWELDWLTKNADALAHRAPAVAAELLEHALRHTPDDDLRHSALEDHLAAVSFPLGRYEQTVKTTRRIMAGTADAERRAQAAWFLSYSLSRLGEEAKAVEVVTETCDDPDTSEVWRARLTARAAMIAVSTGRFDDADAAVALAVADGVRLNDPMTVGYALHVGATTRFVEQDIAGSLAMTSRGLAVVGTDPHLAELRLILYNKQIAALTNLDRFAEAVDTLRTARALGERTGSPRLASYAIEASELAYQLGDWDDALAELDTLAVRTNLVSRPDDAVLIHGIAALIAGHRDDQRAAGRHLNRLPDDMELVLFKRLNSGYALMARAVAHEQAGRKADAAATLKVLLGPAYEGLEHRSSILPILVRLALDVDDAPTACDAAAAAETEAQQNPLPRATAAGHWCRGLYEGDPEPVLAAAEYFRSSGRRLELGNALEDAALLLAAADERDAARDALAQSLAAYAELGAVWDTRRASARLRPHGIRPGVRRARRRPQTGWDALTETEIRVADLVRSGRSNPDIAARLLLSRRTVETHVSHILAKLQAASRREIADLAEERINSLT